MGPKLRSKTSSFSKLVFNTFFPPLCLIMSISNWLTWGVLNVGWLFLILIRIVIILISYTISVCDFIKDFILKTTYWYPMDYVTLIQHNYVKNCLKKNKFKYFRTLGLLSFEYATPNNCERKTHCFRTKSLLSKFASRAKRIDVISRFIFPLLFAIFNLAYWLYYLLAKGSNEDFQEWDDHHGSLLQICYFSSFEIWAPINLYPYTKSCPRVPLLTSRRVESSLKIFVR